MEEIDTIVTPTPKNLLSLGPSPKNLLSLGPTPENVLSLGPTPENLLSLGPTPDIAVSKEVILPPQQDFTSGVLPNFIDNWKAITTDPVTLDAVSGLTIPFKYLPPCRLPTQEELSSADTDPVVDTSVAELLALKAAVVVPNNTTGFYSRVFTVPKMERGVEYGKRFIINLKVSFIQYQDNGFIVSYKI